MSDFDRPGTYVEEGAKRRSASSRFADLGDRLAKTFGTAAEPDRPERPRWEQDLDLDYPPAADTMAWAPAPERFPVVERGYDPMAVDDEIRALERELGELRAKRIESSSVQDEIDKIGQQTASILRTAYEQAHEITHSARVQADKCVADAAANAVAITEDANRRLREIDGETDTVWQERSRLIEDARHVAGELMTLADNASQRFREEGGKTAGKTAASTEIEKPAVLETETPAEPTGLVEPFDHEQSGLSGSES